MRIGEFLNFSAEDRRNHCVSPKKLKNNLAKRIIFGAFRRKKIIQLPALRGDASLDIYGQEVCAANRRGNASCRDGFFGVFPA
jgi:hypothetical protein